MLCVSGCAANDHFYVAFVTPCVHYTMGGVRHHTHTNRERELSHPHTHVFVSRCVVVSQLRISPSTSVLRSLPDTSTASGTSLQPIPGLFAAGEIVGGVHGANRLAGEPHTLTHRSVHSVVLSGNGLLECLVFGRLAGRRAANTALIPPYEGALPFQHGSYAQLRLREVRDVNSNGLKIFRFDLPSERQVHVTHEQTRRRMDGRCFCVSLCVCVKSTGLSVGQYIAIDSEPHLGPPPSSNHSAEKPFSVLRSCDNALHALWKMVV